VRFLIALGDIERAWQHTSDLLAAAEERHDRFSLAQALHGKEVLAHLQGKWEAARDFSDQGLAAGPRDARLLNNRVMLEYQLGNFDQGNAYLERLLEAMRLAPPGGLEYRIAPLAIGVAAHITGRAGYSEVAEAAAEIILSSSYSPFPAQLVRTGLALLAVVRGDLATAEEQYVALKPWQITLTPLNLVCGHRVLGLLAQTMGRLNQAMTHFENALAFCRQGDIRPELAWTCYNYAETLVQRHYPGDQARAISLLDESVAIAQELGIRPLAERVLALQERAASQPETPPTYPDGLTQREVEVLCLIATGKSNSEIAEALVLSVRTVERHITNIYAKINARGRADATSYAIGQGLTH